MELNVNNYINPSLILFVDNQIAEESKKKKDKTQDVGNFHTLLGEYFFWAF